MKLYNPGTVLKVRKKAATDQDNDLARFTNWKSPDMDHLRGQRVLVTRVIDILTVPIYLVTDIYGNEWKLDGRWVKKDKDQYWVPEETDDRFPNDIYDPGVFRFWSASFPKPFVDQIKELEAAHAEVRLQNAQIGPRLSSAIFNLLEEYKKYA